MKRKGLLIVFLLVFIAIAGCAPMQDQQPGRQPGQDGQQGQQGIQGVQSSVVGEDVIKRVKVTTDKANIRNGCSADAPVLQSAEKNKTLDVINKVADWYAVKLPNDKIGFVKQSQVKPVVVEDNKPAAGGGQAGGTQAGGAPEGGGQAGGTPAQENPSQQNPAAGNEQKIPDNTDNNNGSLSSEEQEMLRLVNEARKQNNVAPLAADIPLTKVARVKSQDMIDNNYFSHNSPTYGSPFDMMKDFGINYVKAGENIAGNQNVQKAHESLMNSPGHRKNILSPDYTHIGIGIKQGGQYGIMFTQMFISKPK
jgi:uncharacterized YkwD family protein